MENDTMPTPLTLAIPDMTCGSCLSHVRAAIASVSGAEFAAVDLRRQRVAVRVDSDNAREALLVRLADEGYPATIVSG